MSLRRSFSTRTRRSRPQQVTRPRSGSRRWAPYASCAAVQGSAPAVLSRHRTRPLESSATASPRTPTTSFRSTTRVQAGGRGTSPWRAASSRRWVGEVTSGRSCSPSRTSASTWTRERGTSSWRWRLSSRMPWSRAAASRRPSPSGTPRASAAVPTQTSASSSRSRAGCWSASSNGRGSARSFLRPSPRDHMPSSAARTRRPATTRLPRAMLWTGQAGARRSRCGTGGGRAAM
mmetsp:Transcript_61662/g.194391  ORF Transcript_61662/g.194391 Transcript_61662/m.194391 type:complete len:233 (-) Transcript_61662:568-1266(-)